MVKFRDIYMRASENTKDYCIIKAKSKKIEKQRHLKYRQLCDGKSGLASCQEMNARVNSSCMLSWLNKYLYDIHIHSK